MMRGALVAVVVGLGVMGAAVTAQEQAGESEDADAPEYSRKGADSCLACHDDNQAVLALFRGQHAIPSDPHGPFGSGQLQCEACHGPGGEHAGRVRRGAERPPMPAFAGHPDTPVTAENEMCLTCHEADAATPWHGGVHAANDVGCADCHDSHVARDPMLLPASQSAVCATCHQGVVAQTRKHFSHPLAMAEMACSDCHNPHGGTDAESFVRETANETCYSCHAEKRGPYLWEHAPVAEDCGTCHAPHGSNQPGMLVQRGPLLCQDCHSQAGHPSIPQTATGLADGMPSKYLLGENCMNCHSQVHGSNHPSGSKLMR